MGTETKFNCYNENTTTATTGIRIIPKAFNGTSAVASGFVVGAKEKLYNSTTNGILNGFLQHKQPHQNGPINGCCSVVDCSALCTQATSTLPKAQPVFVPVHIGEDVIEGARNILKTIRPNWDLNAVQFKKFTDGITNKLVGCFYNPPIQQNFNNGITTTRYNSNGNTPTHNGNGIEIGSTNTHGNGDSSLLITDDNNDSGNISDSDTLDADINPGADAEEETTTLGYDANSYCESNVVLVRIYGNNTDLLIDRKAETRNIQLLHSYGFAPTLYATFKNGLAYDYVPGVTLNTTNVLEPQVWRLVACRMAEMHRVVKVRDVGGGGDGGKDIPSTTVPMLWQKTQNFFDLVPEHFSDPAKHKRIEGTFLPIQRLRDEFTSLYRRLETLDSPVVFAHNDLLLGNIVYLESQQCVNFIDYEYAAYNFQAFDIGNHFCEFAGVDDVDYTRYPSREFQLEWLRVYLQTYLQRVNISDAEVERLYVQVNLFALAAHFFWIIWSLIQAEHSNIDFDYVDYALMRYKEYTERKATLLALDTSGDPGNHLELEESSEISESAASCN